MPRLQEKRLIAKFFEEISQDTNKYVFGVKDTLMCLDMGAVETLLVWESLDCDRYELNNTVTGAWGSAGWGAGGGGLRNCGPRGVKAGGVRRVFRGLLVWVSWYCLCMHDRSYGGAVRVGNKACFS